jgi:hypothetical protein
MIHLLRQMLDGKTVNSAPKHDATSSTEWNACQVLLTSDNNNEIRQTLAALRASHAHHRKSTGF